ncbi:hypothetical protein RFI_23333 [Reticulomyxa filosa]|uniref:Uncharacterized protein n=1 Tax=Reticulomyxa filosa TaxID=46433 RepID=X6MK50_RETFI|nr:hypothetical protein RFI_23333 [Reticulomyxa filosa]|eukprot:ETO14036.1 hypothetical protein RFI_23333 [Reticulomyxa filosa]
MHFSRDYTFFGSKLFPVGQKSKLWTYFLFTYLMFEKNKLFVNFDVFLTKRAKSCSKYETSMSTQRLHANTKTKSEEGKHKDVKTSTCKVHKDGYDDRGGVFDCVSASCDNLTRTNKFVIFVSYKYVFLNIILTIILSILSIRISLYIFALTYQHKSHNTTKQDYTIILSQTNFDIFIIAFLVSGANCILKQILVHNR